MKRYFLLSIVLALLLTLCGCNNSNTDTQTDNNTQQEEISTPDTNTSNEAKEEGLIVDIGVSKDNLYPVIRDVCVVKVLGKTGEIDDSDFGDFTDFIATPVLYQVKVQKSICTQVTTQNQTIKLVHYEIYDENVSYFAKPLEVGKTYLIGGMAQILGDSVVLVDTGVISSEISEGDLIPLSSPAQNNYLKDVETLEEIEAGLGVKKLNEQLTKPSLPSMFESYTVKTDEKEISLNSTTASTADYNSYLSVLREAVKVGSTVQLTKVEDKTAVETK